MTDSSLSDELWIIDQHAHNVSPACDPCDEDVSRTAHLKDHESGQNGLFVKKIWKLKVQQLERTINYQKLKISNDLLNLKEKEFRDNEFCTCKTFCRIVHQKHNWKKSFSHDISVKFRNLKKPYPCNSCDKRFVNVDCLNLHVRSVHVEDSNVESSQREI